MLAPGKDAAPKEPRVEHTHLGRTGLLVSRLCLGTMNFGPETSEEDSQGIMDRALDEGVNFFDTANTYGWKKGEGVTEQILGRWFAKGGGRRDNGVGVIPWSPLAGGLLGGILRKAREGRSASDQVRRRLEAAQPQVEEY